MEERVVTQQSLATLVQEATQALAAAERLYPGVVASLQDLNPHLNLKFQTSLHTEGGRKALEAFKQRLSLFTVQIERLLGAYEDISKDFSAALGARGGQDPILQELERQKAQLAQEIQVRREAAQIFTDLASVMDRIAHQQKATPAQQKKIEDLVFRLQVLG